MKLNESELNKLVWQEKEFTSFTLNEMYALLKLRAAVFVVEQNSVYQDLDDYDQEAVHLCLKNSEMKLVAYSRVFFNKTNNYVILGRVLIDKKYRRNGLGTVLLEKSLTVIERSFPGKSIKIAAQAHLYSFYKKHGFILLGDEYILDGIPHIDMIKKESVLKEN